MTHLRRIMGLMAWAMVAWPVASATAQSVETPFWEKQPDSALASELIPGFALWLGIDGSADLACKVTADGPVYNCRVVHETPAGLGFGSAARVVVASGEIRARRVDGVIAPGMIRTTVRFFNPEPERTPSSWTGPEPSAEQMALARLVAARRVERLEQTQEAWEKGDRALEFDGLDYDRRATVGAWIDELVPDPAAENLEYRAIQTARLFTLEELQAIARGEAVEEPTEEEIANARPDTPERGWATGVEMRRRYCERYDCGASNSR